MPAFDLAQTDRLLTTTRAVRYGLDLDRPVPREVVMECIRIACHAPTGSNTQQYRWVVVDDPDVRALVGEQYRAAVTPRIRPLLDSKVAQGDDAGLRVSRGAIYLAEHMRDVPVIVIVCCDMSASIAHYQALHPTWSPTNYAPTMYASVYPAAWSFQLALRARGLGSTLTTAHVAEQQPMADILGLPDTWVQTCLIPVAYSKKDEYQPAVRRPVDEVVVWNGLRR
jgi:nitroreductase